MIAMAENRTVAIQMLRFFVRARCAVSRASSFVLAEPRMLVLLAALRFTLAALFFKDRDAMFYIKVSIVTA